MKNYKAVGFGTAGADNELPKEEKLTIPM